MIVTSSRQRRSPARVRSDAHPVGAPTSTKKSPQATNRKKPPPKENNATLTARRVSWLFWWPNGLAGISNKGLFGQIPSWVDVQKRPGHTSQSEQLSFTKTLGRVITGREFFMAPHFTWFLMALGMYLIAPYEDAIASAKFEGWARRWVGERLALNFTVAASYYGLFHLGLWHFGWGNRKFLPKVHPTKGNMAHNLWYWTLGIVQWTAWECVMIRLWASGAVPYVSNAQLVSDYRLLAFNALCVLLTPIWRDLHFYIVHRFSHLRAVYKYVHSLHHRNTDPEPFSGLCMHPIEHLYYFSNAWTPALYLSTLSPFIFLFTFVHLAIAPAAGHSGFEDHFQSDQYHYLHHAKFECNYGSPFSACLDMACGTFREALGLSAQYRGEWSEAAVRKDRVAESTPEANAPSTGRRTVWSTQSYLGRPATRTDAIYTLFWLALWPLAYWAFVVNQGPARRVRAIGIGGGLLVPIEVAVGCAIAYGPVVLALVLARLSGDRMSWRWPFHKERLLGTLGVFLLLGWLCCMLPVYHAAQMASAALA